MRKIIKSKAQQSSLILSTLMTFMSGCQPQGGGFAGDGTRSGGAKPQKPPVSQPPAEKKEEPPKAPPCTEAKLETVNSLTSFVDQRATTGRLELELNFAPCPTQAGRVDLPIMFDVNANTMFLEGPDKRLTYEVTIQGKVVAGPGYVNTVLGSDLFGKQGEDYAHFKSDGSLSVAPNISSARLTVQLRKMYVIAPVNSAAQSTTNFTVPIYVKIGQSNPVTAMVAFSPAVIPP
jgi:hypothetical protein